MQLKLELSQGFDMGGVINKTINVDSLDNNLVDVIDRTVGSREKLAFGDYYENVMLMNYNRCYPYIIMNGRYEWVVSYKDVSIRDFVNTVAANPV